VRDFFMEPGKAILVNPRDLGKGLRTGSRSLIEGVAGGGEQPLGLPIGGCPRFEATGSLIANQASMRWGR
jgi:hypothetical protein